MPGMYHLLATVVSVQSGDIVLGIVSEQRKQAETISTVQIRRTLTLSVSPPILLLVLVPPPHVV